MTRLDRREELVINTRTVDRREITPLQGRAHQTCGRIQDIHLRFLTLTLVIPMVLSPVVMEEATMYRYGKIGLMYRYQVDDEVAWRVYQTQGMQATTATMSAMHLWTSSTLDLQHVMMELTVLSSAVDNIRTTATMGGGIAAAEHPLLPLQFVMIRLDPQRLRRIGRGCLPGPLDICRPHPRARGVEIPQQIGCTRMQAAQ